MVSIRTAADLGAVIRDHRRRQGLDQMALAKRVGVSRQWIVEVEKGKTRAGIGLLLRTLEALGVSLVIAPDRPARALATLPPVDLDAIIAAARWPRPR
jgi:HTH-type transcriptional regulator/antitoxin HipB